MSQEPQDTDTAALDWPGDAMAERVAGRISREEFLTQGRMAAADLQRALAAAGVGADDVERLLDFGCGSGRLLMHLPTLLPKTDLWGFDVDAEAVAWCNEHIPGTTVISGEGMPPIDVPAGHFDAVVANSVFTHLDERYQDAWLDELLRITRPGATLVLSTHGEYAFGLIEQPHLAAGTPGVERWRGELDRDGILFWADDGLDPSVHPDYYHTTFHAPWYVFEHWASRFELVAYLPRGLLRHQDYVVLRHPTAQDAPIPVPRREPPEPASSEAPPAAPGRLEPLLERARRQPQVHAVGRRAKALLRRARAAVARG
jgi:SAM-dependent methyltransferase